MRFIDRFLKCSDCGNEFVFTAGEQVFFYDKQFKNDPKRCKLCKAKRAGTAKPGNSDGTAALPLSRTETRTECSACGIETTVPFKPTQGRPVLCRTCFQMKRLPAVDAAFLGSDAAARVEAAAPELRGEFGAEAATDAPASFSSAATMEMIAEAPGAMLSEGDGSELMSTSAKARQA